jgi:hypothetical protein
MQRFHYPHWKQQSSSLGLIWEYSVFSEKLIFKKIADGKSINPTFRNSFRYHIDSDVETGNYDLQISNVTSDESH